MRKAFVAGLAAVAVAGTALALAPSVLSQTRSPETRRDHRVLTLDARGSAIGVSVRDLTLDEAAKAKLDPPGVLIERVDQDGPASKAGLRAGDIVVEFDGERVRSARQFARLVQDTVDGRTVKATIIRDGGRQMVDVTPSREIGRWAGTLTELPYLADDITREVERGMRSLPRDLAFDLKWDGEVPMARVWPRGRLGADLSPLTEQLAEYFGAKQGVLVSSVQSESVAAQAGLKAGDVITSINGRPVDTPRDVAEELREVNPGSEIEVGVLRDKKALTLKAQMPDRQRSTMPRKVRPV